MMALHSRPSLLVQFKCTFLHLCDLFIFWLIAVTFVSHSQSYVCTLDTVYSHAAKTQSRDSFHAGLAVHALSPNTFLCSLWLQLLVPYSYPSLSFSFFKFLRSCLFSWMLQSFTLSVYTLLASSYGHHHHSPFTIHH